MNEHRTWTLPELIGHNIKTRRERMSMTAKDLGQYMGAALAKEGKPWPPQTVYMMEAGERSMIAAEMGALAETLDVPLTALFAPPPEPDEVKVGTLTVAPETLSGRGSDLADIARHIRAIDRTSQDLKGLVGDQALLIGNAKGAILGIDVEHGGEDDETLLGSAVHFLRSRAARHYEERDQTAMDLADLEGFDDGE